ncbi:MAG: hypothetical protein ACO276_04645 [Ilumatobacteraceae bacterium]
MLFWFIGTAVLSVWFVFHDPRFDNRALLLGVLLPDAVDAAWGGARGLHSVSGSVAILAIVMVATAGRKPIRRRLLAVPIGTFLHLIFDGAFNSTKVFWWPVTGLSFEGDRLPIVERGMVNVPLEILGIVMCVFAWRRFGLSDPARRREFVTTGSLHE